MTTIMTVRVPENIQRKLKEKAMAQGLTRNALVLQIIWEWLEKEEIRSTKAVSLDLSKRCNTEIDGRG